MYKLAKPFFMICETPLHAGSGNDLGIVDLPIQRERHTNFPKVESSSLKGCIREAFESYMYIENNEYKLNNKKESMVLQEIFPSLTEAWKKDDKNQQKYIRFNQALDLSFGPENGEAYAGSLGFTDARLLLFPVKSMKGVFAWITCPKVLKRFKNDLNLSGLLNLPDFPSENTIPCGSNLLIKSEKVILEEYCLNVKEDKKTKKFAKLLAKVLFSKDEESLYWKEKLEKDLVVLSDDDFRDFVTFSTEVITRTKIDNVTGTVKDGNLFTEEYLPSETVLYSLVLATPIFNRQKGIFTGGNKNEEEILMNFFTNGFPRIIQMGGNATLGKGLIRTKIMECERK